MNKKDFIRKACTRKTRYDERFRAVLAKIKAEANTGSVHNVYKCDFCPGWHIGHSNPPNYY